MKNKPKMEEKQNLQDENMNFNYVKIDGCRCKDETQQQIKKTKQKKNINW